MAVYKNLPFRFPNLAAWARLGSLQLNHWKKRSTSAAGFCLLMLLTQQMIENKKRRLQQNPSVLRQPHQNPAFKSRWASLTPTTPWPYSRTALLKNSADEATKWCPSSWWRVIGTWWRDDRRRLTDGWKTGEWPKEERNCAEWLKQMQTRGENVAISRCMWERKTWLQDNMK